MFGDHRDEYAPDCYGARLLAYLKFGYLPALVKPVPESYVKNYTSLYRFPGLRSAWLKQKSMGGVFTRGDRRYLSPLSAVVRAMDVYRLRGTGKSPKVRVCWDGRGVNECIASWPSRYEDFPAVLRQLNRDEWYSLLDIRSFYLNLPMHSTFQKFLSLTDPISGEIIAYKRLPFGLKPATTFASAVSAEAAKIAQLQLSTDTAVHVYIDDVLERSPREDTSSADIETTERVFADLGLPAATEKTVKARQRAKHIGRVIDSVAMTVEVSEAHRACAAGKVQALLGGHRPGRREFHSLCGLLNFLLPAIRGAKPYLRPFWRHLRNLPAAPAPRL